MKQKDLSPRMFAGVMIAVITLVLVKAALAATDLTAAFVTSGNDDIMRLVMIRDWLNGQDWFDTTQYRLVPPDGVLMHWSRYLDVAIAAFIFPLSFVFPMEQAELIAVAIWPTLLMVLLILTIGFGARRVFGTGPACVAMLFAALWPFTSDFYFGVGHIDHHNVQVLMLAVMTLAAIWPDRAVLSGVVAGLAAAFSLAIGLENLAYILVLGMTLLVRAIFDMDQWGTTRLRAFCAALCIAAPVLWLGQTAYARLNAGVCDQLGVPVLSLIAIASIASFAATLPILRAPVARLVVATTLTVIGCGLAWPALGACITQPYADLPLVVQQIIGGAIVEALPGMNFAGRSPSLYHQMMTPVAVTLCLALVVWWSARKQASSLQGHQVLGMLLILGSIGFLASFSQMRLLSMASGVVPLLAGVGLWHLFCQYRNTHAAGYAITLLGTAVLILSPALIEAPLRQALQTAPTNTQNSRPNCPDMAIMAALNELPPSQILTPMNLGPLLLFATHHDAMSGTYHRRSIPNSLAHTYRRMFLPMEFHCSHSSRMT